MLFAVSGALRGASGGRTLAGPALALPITCLLIAVAALFAPGSAPGSGSRGRRGAVRNALGGMAVPMPSARAVFALVPLGVGLGVPLALGLMPGNAVALVGAFGACTAGHCLLGGATGASGTLSGALRGASGTSSGALRGASGSSSGALRGASGTLSGALRGASGWLALLSFCVLASVIRFSTLDLRAALAAQAAIGPGALGGPLRASAVDVLGALVGLMAGAAWVEHLPRLAGSPEAEGLDTALRWGESALVAAAVSAQVWGPSAGALLHGPLGVLVVPVAASTLVTLAAVALVSILRSKIGNFPASALVATLAPVALIALLAARIA